MKKSYVFLLLAAFVFAACNDSIEEIETTTPQGINAAEESVPIEELVPVMATMTKAQYDSLRLTNNANSGDLVTIDRSNESTPETKAVTVPVWKIEYNWLEDLTYITFRGVTDYQPEWVKKAVTVSQDVANRWGIDPGYYFLYSWKLTLQYRQGRAHSWVEGDYAGVKPSNRNEFGYDRIADGTNQWNVTTMYYRYEWRTSANSEIIKGVYCLPPITYNAAGSFFETFKWQYTLQGDFTTK